LFNRHRRVRLRPFSAQKLAERLRPFQIAALDKPGDERRREALRNRSDVPPVAHRHGGIRAQASHPDGALVFDSFGCEQSSGHSRQLCKSEQCGKARLQPHTGGLDLRAAWYREGHENPDRQQQTPEGPVHGRKWYGTCTSSSPIPRGNFVRQERRKHFRVTQLFVGQWHAASGAAQVRIADLSAGGCFVQSLAMPKQGERTSVSVTVGDSVFRFSGHVVYLDRIGFSMKFDPISESEAAELDSRLTAMAAK
jgi:hypothetical protein